MNEAFDPQADVLGDESNDTEVIVPEDAPLDGVKPEIRVPESFSRLLVGRRRRAG